MLQSASPVDRESHASASDHGALRLWLRLLTCTQLVERRVRRALRERFEQTLPRFDLLAQLERCPEGLKMSELSRRLMVTGGNVTALADQLEAEGLIQREPVADDRRATKLQLTPEGRRVFAGMAVEHEAWVVAMFDGLSRDEQRQLQQLLGKLKAGLAGAPETPARPTPTRRRTAR